jgi:signal transduction histidine kinase
MASLSLRARLLTAAILFTIGLFIGAVVLATVMMFHYPSSPRIMHGLADVHATPATVLVVVLLAAGFVLVRSSLTSLKQLRAGLAEVHAGRETTVPGTYPGEIQPLVDDLNALLDHREQMVRRALAKAGDLAHGLKTPLAVMSQEAERARDRGHAEMAETMLQQIERMRRQIEYHLAQARAAASGTTPGARCNVRESAEGLVRTLERLYAERGLALAVTVDPDHSVRAQREDLDEMLGNLLDNACKWARSRVALTSAQQDGTIVITVDDDGQGLAPEMRDVVLKRGVRADEAAPGSGLGLAIVRDLAELYGGSISLAASPDGGVRASLALPG